MVRKLKWIGKRDAPDRFFAKSGRALWVEFKRPGEEPRETQKREISAMRKAGLEVLVIDNVRDFKRALGL